MQEAAKVRRCELIQEINRYRSVILLCAEDEHCKKVSDEDITSFAGEVFIEPVPIGRRVSQTEAIDAKATPPVTLSLTGIELTYFGKATVVYYWDAKHKKMDTIRTGD